jgi:hypothetical protein
MSKKKKSLIEEVEEMAKKSEETNETIDNEIQTNNDRFVIQNSTRNLAVRNEKGEVIGTIENGTEIVGTRENDRIRFEFNGVDGYVKVNRVRTI